MLSANFFGVINLQKTQSNQDHQHSNHQQRMLSPYRTHSTNLFCTSIDWFLYEWEFHNPPIKNLRNIDPQGYISPIISKLLKNSRNVIFGVKEIPDCFYS